MLHPFLHSDLIITKGDALESYVVVVKELDGLDRFIGHRDGNRFRSFASGLVAYQEVNEYYEKLERECVVYIHLKPLKTYWGSK